MIQVINDLVFLLQNYAPLFPNEPRQSHDPEYSCLLFIISSGRGKDKIGLLVLITFFLLPGCRLRAFCFHWEATWRWMHERS